VWWIRDSDVINSQAGSQATNVLEKLLKYLDKLIHAEFLDDAHGWVVPYQPEAQEMAVSVVKATIHGKLLQTEEVAHTFHFVGHNADITDLDGVATVLLAGWTDFLSTGAVQLRNGGSGFVRDALSPDLVYDQLSLASIAIAPPAKPAYLIRTQFYPMPANTKGNGPISLPYEVAMCMSLGTAKRGPRYRGRSYLGPLAPAVLDDHGSFVPGCVQGVGAALWTKFLNRGAIRATLDPVIASYKFGTAEPITNVRSGLIPDSMRTRRKQLSEAYHLDGGVATG
jgi:hypothetical protein